MADIEDRADKWAKQYIQDNDMPEWYEAWQDSLIAAYLAGSQQTQQDYIEHYSRRPGHP